MNKRNIKLLVVGAVILVAGFFAYKQTQGSEITSDVSFAYVTDSQARGVFYSGEGVESGISISTEVFDSLDLNVSLDNKHAFDEQDDSVFGVELGASVLNGIDLGVGFLAYNGHNFLDGQNELYVEAGFDFMFDPSATVYYNSEAELWTVEGSVGHSLDILGQEVNLSAFLGDTELPAGDSHVYYGVEASIAYEINEDLTLGAGVAYVDSNSSNLEGEFIFSVGLSTQF